MAAHDPSDTGPDSKGYAMRHGIVVLRVEEKTDGSVNEGGHWACGLANNDQVDTYTWDCDGMGAALTEQTANAFKGTNRVIAAFKGSETPDTPDAMYEPTDASIIQGRQTFKDTFHNKRSQYYFDLRDRIYRTYRAVEFKEYCDPDKLISFSSKIQLLSKVRAELCRMPVKPNGSGLLELYTKQAMKAKFKIQSPNLGDSVMMLMRPVAGYRVQSAYIPKPRQVMGGRR
jgi:phage terminase large subunit